MSGHDFKVGDRVRQLGRRAIPNGPVLAIHEPTQTAWVLNEEDGRPYTTNLYSIAPDLQAPRQGGAS